MRRPGKPNEPEEPLLFDLPLAAPGSEEPEELPVTPRRRASAETRRMGPVPVPELADREEIRPAPIEFAGRVRRLAAGVADLIVHAAVGVLALLGCRWLEVRPEIHEWPAFAAFLLVFSFLYTVLPLAFWGHTPGMAWAAITSRNRDGEPLTFDQTVRRWLGALLTLALVGLPLLLAFGGRTLTDWISGSATYPFEEEE
ncbi:MAG TPA: RDD family protein [Thermoanaerobaculia bacterium]